MAYFKSNKVETRIANILKGTSDPASSIGDNGQLYLKYADLSLREYIEVGSTAGPYINTGFYWSSDCEFEIKAKWTGTPANNTAFFGAYSPNQDTDVQVYNGNTLFYVGGGGTASLSIDTDDHIYKATQSELLLDGTSVATPNWSRVPASLEVSIFTMQQHSPAINARIYYIKIWKSGELHKYFIPAVNNATNEIGMFEAVSGEFYSNDGTGNFDISSSVILDMPSRPILSSFAKVNDQWQSLIGTNVDEITYASNPPKTVSYLKWQITKSRSVPAGGCIQIAEFRLYQNAEKYVWNSNVSISSDMTGVSGETIDKLIDDNTNTKFNTQDWGSVQENECNIIINLGETITLTNTSSYCFVTANDEISRDPVSWKLYSSVDGTNWDLLDERTDADVPTDRERQTFNYPCKISGGSPQPDDRTYLFKDGEWKNQDILSLYGYKTSVENGSLKCTGTHAGVVVDDVSGLDSSVTQYSVYLKVRAGNINSYPLQTGRNVPTQNLYDIIQYGTDRYSYNTDYISSGTDYLFILIALYNTDGIFLGAENYTDENAYYYIDEIWLEASAQVIVHS